MSPTASYIALHISDDQLIKQYLHVVSLDFVDDDYINESGRIWRVQAFIQVFLSFIGRWGVRQKFRGDSVTVMESTYCNRYSTFWLNGNNQCVK